MPPNRPLNFQVAGSRYQVLIGTGGVGGGMFFALNGNTTLGREESRSGRILPQKDYCKLHIIAHYVKVLLGPQFTVLPASKVGGDALGQQMLAAMEETGFDNRYMEISPGDATLFSVCFIYPDGSGGNLTASNAATAHVDIAFINRLEAEFGRWRGHGIALAAPEVPLAARQRLLELAGAADFFRVASLTSEEARSPAALDLLAHTDLLAINLDEAAALSGVAVEKRAPADICAAVLEKTRAVQPGLQLSVTAGVQGSWNWDGDRLAHTPAFPARVASSAGSGDAHLAGTISGLAAGLRLPQAQQLGTLAAAFSVTSGDTIHPGLNCEALNQYAIDQHLELAPQVWTLIARADPPGKRNR